MLLPFNRILAPVDFSDSSREALEQAAALAVDHEAKLTIIHVHPIETTAFMDYAYVEQPEHLSRVCAQAEKKLKEWHGALKHTPYACTQVVATGNTVDTLISLSEEHDLIVMATHGRTGLSHFLLGSVAERVVQGAKCSVMVVRPHQDPGLPA